jgi:hypothetical protein
MDSTAKPYVQFSTNEVPAVALDREGRCDPDQVDRYATFEEARDAALSIIELTLDAGDYDDDAHRDELTRMLGLLESAPTFAKLAARREYKRFLAGGLVTPRAVA